MSRSRASTAPGIPSPVLPGPDGTSLRLLDQTTLPGTECYLDLQSATEVADAIRTLKVRGAPAIGVAGAFGMALGVRSLAEDVSSDPSSEDVRSVHDLLLHTRPTGRNLAWALARVTAACEAAAPGAMSTAAWTEALAVLEEETAACRRIGEAGLDLLPPPHRKVLTHCNAGALATTGIGTALAPLYLAQESGTAPSVVACETRPVLQGARLTAWELSRSGIPVTVVTDSMAGARMAKGDIGMVIVGADAVAMNGDVANKIGTYGLAVLAKHHGIPFYVAAPASTFEPAFATGADIPIETRDEAELRAPYGIVQVPEDALVWNPAFDVTPAHLVTALITDLGVLRPPYRPAIATLLTPPATSPTTENP